MELITSTPVMDFGNTIWWDSVREPWLYCVQNRKDDIVSRITKSLGKSEKAINALLEKVDKLKSK